MTTEQMARRFHEAYERLATQFGYGTRPDTKVFDPESKNGKLMMAVCAELFPQVPLPSNGRFYERFERMWHDLIESPAKHTMRYAGTAALFSDADAEIELLRSENRTLRNYCANNGLPVETPAPASNGESLRGCLESILAKFKEADDERYRNQKEWEADAEKWKADSDMYGWNFHKGMGAGANWVALYFFRVQRELEEILKGLPVETFDEPAAWMTEDGRLMPPELKRNLTERQTASFSIPLYMRRPEKTRSECPVCKAKWEMQHDQYCDYRPQDRTGHILGMASAEKMKEVPACTCRTFSGPNHFGFSTDPNCPMHGALLLQNSQEKAGDKHEG